MCGVAKNARCVQPICGGWRSIRKTGAQRTVQPTTPILPCIFQVE